MYLVVTQGCSNQCLICGMRGAGSGPVKFGRQMPFPVAVKIMIAAADSGMTLVPYRDSDPLDYFDGPTGATIDDILVVSRELDYREVAIITHGSNSRRQQSLAVIPAIVSEFDLYFSVHLFQGSVLAYALESLDPGKDRNELRRKREDIVERYAGRYASMLAVARSPDRTVGAHVFNQEAAIRYLEDKVRADGPRNSPVAKALAVLKVIQSIQNDVWKRALDKTGRNMQLVQIKSDVMWIGKAAQFLQRLGVPDDIIADMQKKSEQQTNLSSGAFDPVIGTDGSLSIAASEDQEKIVRTVGEAFPDPVSAEFKRFLKFARAVVKAGDDLRTPAPIFIYDDDIKRRELGRCRNYFKGSRPGAENLNLDDLVLRYEDSFAMNSFLELGFPGAKDALLSLEEGKPVSDEAARALYRLLEQMPFIVDMSFSITLKKGPQSCAESYEMVPREEIEYDFKYSFVPPGNEAVKKRDIFHPYRVFPLAQRAFAQPGAAESRVTEQKDGGAVSPGGIDLRRLPVSVAQGRAPEAALEESPELDNQRQNIQD